MTCATETRSDNQGQDWAIRRPARQKPHELRGVDDEDRPLVSVLLPRFRNAWLQRWADRTHLAPFRLKLDAVGSFVWLRCDGHTTVADLGEALSSEFGPSVEPVEERLTRFLAQLQRGGLVALDPTHRARLDPG